MSVEELADRLQRLSRAELSDLARRVPGLWDIVQAEKQRQLAETRVAYQVEEVQEGPVPAEKEVLTPEERRAMNREELAARYKNPVQWTEHPWVVRVAGYNSGRPILLGTSVAVRTIAIAWLHHGMAMTEVLENWPVHEAQVYDALSYYYDHQIEIDEDIKADSEERLKELYPPGKYKVA